MDFIKIYHRFNDIVPKNRKVKLPSMYITFDDIEETDKKLELIYCEKYNFCREKEVKGGKCNDVLILEY